MTQHVFIDEYGDHSLEVDKQGVTTNYIIVGIAVNDQEEVALRSRAKLVSEKYFSGGELKSSSVSRNHKRRISILKELVSANQTVHVLSIDKSRLIKSGGLIYKRPFLKYAQSIMHKRLCLANTHINIKADEHGGTDFMSGFKDYVYDKHYQSDLFIDLNFGFVDSESEPLIQIADIYAGSVARVFDPKKYTDQAKEILDVLRPVIVSLEHWPLRLRGFVEPLETSKEDEELIRIASQRVALSFLEEFYESVIPENRYRCETVNYLLYKQRNPELDDFTPAHEIIENVNKITGQDISEQQFRATITGPLRDKGIMIVSNSNGYKIAETYLELTSFVGEVDRRVKPQLKRISNFRDTALSVSNGEIDIFEGQSDYLTRAINTIREST